MQTPREQLAVRVRRLNELIDALAPDEIVANEVVLVLKASVDVMPQILTPALGIWLTSIVKYKANYTPPKIVPNEEQDDERGTQSDHA